jgi:hypothetical protein
MIGVSRCVGDLSASRLQARPRTKP